MNDTPPLLLDLRNAAELLGLTRSATRRLVLREELPSIRAGKGAKIFIPRDAIRRFCDRLK